MRYLTLLFSFIVISNCFAQPDGNTELESLEAIKGTINKPTYSMGCNNGSITLNINGGFPPYTYIWSNGKSTSSINNLTEGTYSVTVTDNHCGEAGTEFEVKCIPFAIHLQELNFCSENNGGSINVNILSDQGEEYEVNWVSSNSNFTPNSNLNQTNLEEGIYCITVTNSQGLETSECYTIECCDGNFPIDNIKITSNNCIDIYENSIILSSNSGEAPYSAYLSIDQTVISVLDSPNFGDEFKFQNLNKATLYNFYLKDKNGCTSENEEFYFKPKIEDDITLEDVSYNDCKHIVRVYDYFKDNISYPYKVPVLIKWKLGSESGEVLTEDVVEDLIFYQDGDLSISVNYPDPDCSVIYKYKKTLSGLESIKLSQTIVDKGCGSCHQSIDFSGLGYKLDIHDNTCIKIFKGNKLLNTYCQNEDLIITDLCEGTYTIVVESETSINCFGRYEITLEGNNLIFNEELEFEHTAKITHDKNMCSGDGNPNSGEIQITPKIDYPCITYTWSTGDTTNTITGLEPGIYTLKISFQNGDEYGSSNLTFTIEEIEGTEADFKISIEAIEWEHECEEYNPEGQGTVTVTGIPNTKEYEYIWSNGDVGPTANISYENETNSPSVTVTDVETGCTSIKEIGFNCCKEIYEEGGGSAIVPLSSIYESIHMPSTESSYDGKINVIVFPTHIKPYYNWFDDQGNIISYSKDLANVGPGTYTLKAFNGCSEVSKTFVLKHCQDPILENLASFTILQKPCIEYIFPHEVKVHSEGKVRVNMTAFFNIFPKFEFQAYSRLWNKNNKVYDLPSDETFYFYYRIPSCGKHAYFRIELGNDFSQATEVSNYVNEEGYYGCGYDISCNSNTYEVFESAELQLLSDFEIENGPNPDNRCQARLICPVNGSEIPSPIAYGEYQCFEVLEQNDPNFGCIVNCRCVFSEDVADNKIGIWTETNYPDCETVMFNANNKCEDYVKVDEIGCITFYECIDDPDDVITEETISSKCSFYDLCKYYNIEYCENDCIIEDYEISTSAFYDQNCPNCIREVFEFCNVIISNDTINECNENASVVFYSESDDEYIYHTTLKGANNVVKPLKTKEKAYFENGPIETITYPGYEIISSVEIEKDTYAYIVKNGDHGYSLIKYNTIRKEDWIVHLINTEPQYIRVLKNAANTKFIDIIAKDIDNTYKIIKYSLEGTLLSEHVIDQGDNIDVSLDQESSSYMIVKTTATHNVVTIVKENTTDTFNLPLSIFITHYSINKNGNTIIFYNYYEGFSFEGFSVTTLGTFNAGFLVIDDSNKIIGLHGFKYFDNMLIKDIAYDKSSSYAISLYKSDAENLVWTGSIQDDPNFCPLLLLLTVSESGATLVNKSDINEIRTDLQNENFEVFPNPFSNTITIIPECDKNTEVDINIYSISGQIMYSATDIKCNNDIDITLNESIKGMLFIELILDGENIVRKKVIKL